MKVLIVTGIWPPDVGGPASHSPELAAWSARARARGGGPDDGRGGARGRAVSGALGRPFAAAGGSARGVRAAAGAARAPGRRRLRQLGADARRGRRARSRARPVVVKLTDDPAYERARRFGLFAGDLDGFQRFAGGASGARVAALRDGALRRASLVVCPSAYLREHALGWGLEPDRVVVVENATPELPELPTREEARSELGVDGALLAFAGRLGPAKALDVALDGRRRARRRRRFS